MAEFLADVEKVFKAERELYTGEALKRKQEGYVVNVADPTIGLEKVVRDEDGDYHFASFSGLSSSSSASGDGNVAGFDGVTGKVIKDLGFKLKKNDDFDLVEYTAANGSVLKIGYDDVIPFKNDTGTELAAGTYMHLVNVATVGSEIMATFEKTDASNWEKIQGTIGATSNIVPINGTGFIVVKGQIGAVDTTHIAGPTQIWLSETVAGGFTDVEPAFPAYSVSVGGGIDSLASGNILVNITGNYKETFHDGWDGAIRQSFDFRVDASGGVITGTLTNVDPAENLTCLFSGGFYTLDTTTVPLTIVLTAGTNEVTQANYVYIPKSTKVLAVSTSGFPVDEHCKIAVVDCQSAAEVEAHGGARGNQNHNDHIKKESDNGHILHLSEWIRKQFATIDPRNGCEVTLDDTAGNGYLTMTSGQVEQLHAQSIDSIVMPTSPVMIANDFTSPFIETTNLNTITAYSDGTTWSNKWGKIVVWVIANKSGEPSFLAANLPSAGLTSSADAIADVNNYASYAIPIQYKSKAVLLGAFAIKVGGGIVTFSDDYQDLRGTVPSNVAGGGTGGAGVSSFLALSDTPSSFVGQAGKTPAVNSGETALEFKDNDIEQVLINGSNANGESITNLGNVGIGTDSPSAKLDVKGSPIVNGDTRYEAFISEDNTVATGRGGGIAFGLGADVLGGIKSYLTGGLNDNSSLKFATRTSDVLTEKMMIDYNGLITAPNMSIPDINADTTGKALATKEYVGELKFTIPPLGSVNVTASGSITQQCSYYVTYGHGATLNIATMRFSSTRGAVFIHNSYTDYNTTEIAQGYTFTNDNASFEMEVTIKAIGLTDINQLIKATV